MGKSRKFRNVQRNPTAALVDADPSMSGFSPELIRIMPRWIGSWGLDGDSREMKVRT